MLDLEQRAIFGRIPLPQRGEADLQLTHHGILPPIGMASEVGHHRGALVDFADAFERFVFLQAAQLGKPISLGLVV